MILAGTKALAPAIAQTATPAPAAATSTGEDAEPAAEILVAGALEPRATGQTDPGQQLQITSPSFNSARHGVNGATNHAGFVDVVLDISDAFLVAALRYENGGDFGGNVSGKCAGRDKIIDSFAVRNTCPDKSDNRRDGFPGKAASCTNGQVAYSRNAILLGFNGAYD